MLQRPLANALCVRDNVAIMVITVILVKLLLKLSVLLVVVSNVLVVVGTNYDV